MCMLRQDDSRGFLVFKNTVQMSYPEGSVNTMLNVCILSPQSRHMAHLRAAAAPTHASKGMRAKGPITGGSADAGLVHWSNPAVTHRGEAQ